MLPYTQTTRTSTGLTPSLQQASAPSPTQQRQPTQMQRAPAQQAQKAPPNQYSTQPATQPQQASVGPRAYNYDAGLGSVVGGAVGGLNNLTGGAVDRAVDAGVEASGNGGNPLAAGGASAMKDMAEMWQSLEQGWQQGAGPPPEYMPYAADIISQFGFQPGGLGQAVGQNWTTAMDPLAWEQRAQNLYAQQQEALRSSMNEAARRARGAGARSGFTPNAMLGNIYGQYGQGLVDAQRNIFNDSLAQQMNAMQGAGQFALGQQGMDQQRWAQQLGMLNQAGMFDAAQRAGNHTTFGEAVGGMANVLAGITGGATSSAASLAPLLMGL